MNLWNFPFDEQFCSLNVEPFRWGKEAMMIKIGKFKKENFNENDQWYVDLIEAEDGIEHYSGNYTNKILKFHFKFKRKSLYYALSIILPCLVIAGVELSTFTIPFDKFVRLQLSFMSLLSFSVFQGMFQSQLPHSSDHPPLLFLFIGTMTISIGFVILCQALAVYFSHKATTDESSPGKTTTLTTRMIRFISRNRNDENVYFLIAKLCNDIAFYSFLSFVVFCSPIILFAILPFVKA